MTMLVKDKKKDFLMSKIDLYKGDFNASEKTEPPLLYKLSVTRIKVYNIVNKELIK